MRDRAWADTERQSSTIEKVVEGKDGYEIHHNGAWAIWCQKVPGIVPKVGDRITLWGRGIGSTVRGIAIGNRVVRYETAAQERARHAQEIAEQEERERLVAETARPETARRVAALPDVFQRRLDRFKAGNPDFWWKFQPYELFCCEQAVEIACALKTPEAVRDFRKLEWEQQKRLVPALSDGHSGNTFGMAVRLAYWYLTTPENVQREHGAMVPLVGCLDYGCTHDEAHAVASSTS